MSVSLVCKLLKRSRQSYYKALKANKKHFTESEKLLEMIQPIRQLMPRIGGRKIYFMIQRQLAQNALKIGRDRFFRWLGEQDLLISPKRSYMRTTQSNHRFWIYDNLTQELTLQQPNQLWVSDITYVRTMEGFCYLALITDAFSRKIVGYDMSDSLELEGCIRALKSAFRSTQSVNQLIHHSDRGIQYCSNQYIEILKQHQVKISMAAKGNCYENALAERVNGILKNEFHLDTTFKTKKLAIEAAAEAVYIYNQHRPHWAINLQTPQQCHAA